ncbi:MAG: UbiA prenyltransferase family protein [Eubacteriales bacterium]
MKAYLKLARFDHWVKNFFIVPGIITAWMLVTVTWNVEHILNLILGVMATCFIASANYVINEWLDAEFDQYHPVKKHRPAVTQNLEVKYIIVEYIMFAVAGLVLAFTVNLPFFCVEAVLLFMGIVYNVRPLRTKDIPYVDVLSESINNLLRLLLGWFIVVEVVLPPSSLMLGYWMVGAFLMAVKRFAEYRMIDNPEVAGSYRKSFQKYTSVTLLCSAIFYAMCAVFLVGVFMIKYRVEYIVLIPLMIGIFVYYFYLSYKEDSVVQKPEKLYREKGLLVLVGTFCVLFFTMTFLDVPVLEMIQSNALIQIGS